MDGNYIKFYRKFLEWEWWDDINTSRLFIFMLLKANWKDGNFKGIDVPKGSFVSSIAKLSDGTNLTSDEIRTALKHLKSTDEITSKSHSKFTVFTIKNYCSYQQLPEQITEQFPSKYQASPKQFPSKSQAVPTLFPTIEEGKNIRREEEEEKKEGKNIVTVSYDTVCQTDVRQIMEAWNELQSIGIKPVSQIGKTSKRYKCLIARMNEYGVDKILSAIESIKNSDYLQGKSKYAWVITFDWFVLPSNFPKVLEGNYDNRNSNQNYQSQTAQMLESSYDMMAEWVEERNGNQ